MPTLEEAQIEEVQARKALWVALTDLARLAIDAVREQMTQGGDRK